jgi:hypothetical protein
MLSWHTSSSISDWFEVATPENFMIRLDNIEPDSGDIGHLLPKTDPSMRRMLSRYCRMITTTRSHFSHMRLRYGFDGADTSMSLCCQTREKKRSKYNYVVELLIGKLASEPTEYEFDTLGTIINVTCTGAHLVPKHWASWITKSCPSTTPCTLRRHSFLSAL